MANTELQLYTTESKDYYSQDQLRELNKKLDPRFVSKRKGGGGRSLSYIEGHDAIDNANRIFGFGQWGYRPLSLEQVVLLDPMTGEPVGIEYKALVELTVRGAIAPIVDVGSQPVATWTVDDQIMQRRLKTAQNNKTRVDESEFTPIERREARAVIVEAHEQAKKGAVTDALKRALRAFGEQFGNGLYGDGRVDMSISEESAVESRPAGRSQNGTKQIEAPKVDDAAARRFINPLKMKAMKAGFIAGKTDGELIKAWEEAKRATFLRDVSDAEMIGSEELRVQMRDAIDRHVQLSQSEQKAS